MSSSTIDSTIWYAGIVAAFLLTFLILCQSDRISRIILSPARLRSKRRQEELYRIEKAIATSILYTRKFINEGGFYDWKEEQKITDLILSDEDVETLVREIVIDDSSNAKDEDFQSTPLIVGIAKDLSLPKADEWYIYLAFPIRTGHAFDHENIHYGRRVQVPLEKFGLFLASKFEKQSNQYKLCFIADASSSLGSDVIGKIIENCQCDIPVIQEPVWMYTIAFLIQKQAIHKDSLKKILYSLCKVSAQAVGHKVGDRYNTVAFTLPGQACTLSLLPFIHNIFPDEKQIFAHDTCLESVQRALLLGEVIPDLFMPRNTSSTIPITPFLYLKNVTIQMKCLSHNVACITEAWLGSIYVFHKLKRDKTSKKQYNPFICQMNVLFMQEDDLLKSLLKYITGATSDSKLEMNVTDAAESMLQDLKLKYLSGETLLNMKLLNRQSRIAIENSITFFKEYMDGEELLASL